MFMPSGENGAGKSTLMKVLAGVARPDAGEIEFEGAPLVISSPAVARQHGVGIVYQELSLFPQRSVLANLFVNREPPRVSSEDVPLPYAANLERSRCPRPEGGESRQVRPLSRLRLRCRSRF